MKPRSLISGPSSRGIARTLFLLFITMLAAMPLHLPQAAQASAASQPRTALALQERLSAIDAYVEQERQAARVPGIGLAIVQGDQVVHLQGFGEADPSGRPVTAQTPFVIGSTTKSFTALAIMQLVEAGKLELDAPVQRYLPWFRVADPDASARITVRHLLNHTSGLPRSVGNSQMATSRDMRDSALEEQVRSFSTAELNEPVGATWQYSNAGYVTLGLLVQTVSGQSYEDYVEQHIFAPLQMQRSFTDLTAAQGAGPASGYRYWFGRPVADDAPFNRRLLPAGLLIASAEDMAHYLIAQLNDGRYGTTAILSAAGIAELQRGAVPTPSSAWQGLDEGRYGLGWMTGTRSGVPVIGHRGDTAHFHSAMLLVPEGRWGIVLLMNANNRVSGERMSAITDGVLNLVVGQQPAPVPDTWGLGEIIFGGIMVLALVQVLMMIWSGFTLRRLARSTPGAVQGWLSIARYVVAPLLFYLLLALVFLGGLPLLFSYSWPLILFTLPDMGTVALVCGVAALGWGIIRTAVMVGLLRRGTRRVVPPQAAPAANVQTT